jgi:hypothetical protein
MAMTRSQAKEEFQVRLYYWARSEWERQINESFPDLRSFKAGTAWETVMFMGQLGRREQLLLAGALLKRFHPEAVKTLGETCSSEEESLRGRRDHFFRLREEYRALCELESSEEREAAPFVWRMMRGRALKQLGEIDFAADVPVQQQRDNVVRAKLEDLYRAMPATYEEGVAARKKAGETVRFVGKRKVQKIVMERFEKAFGPKCVDSSYQDVGDPYSSYEIRGCGGWNFSTFFWFGRGSSLIQYSNGIFSEQIVKQRGAKGPYEGSFVLASLLSLCAWLGIRSQTEWEYLATAEEVELACDAALEQCRQFFAVAPKLLAGLDFENLSPDEGP